MFSIARKVSYYFYDCPQAAYFTHQLVTKLVAVYFILLIIHSGFHTSEFHSESLTVQIV